MEKKVRTDLVYGADDSELCTCGHRYGDHDLEAPEVFGDGDGIDCTKCGCANFRRAFPSQVDA